MRENRGRIAVAQARMILLALINIAQLWLLSATIEAALARHYGVLWPLVAASAVCWAIMLSLVLWWRPAEQRYTSTGYVKS